MRRYKVGSSVRHRKFGWLGLVIQIDVGMMCTVAVDWIGMIGYHTKDELRLV